MFLHPEFLWGLSVTIVPVLIHLLARRRTRRVPFPSLRLLRAAERKRRTFSRLQRPLALLLRLMALALISLALAGPITESLPAWLPLPRPKAVVLLLDDTFSMTTATEGRVPLAQAKVLATKLIGLLGDADRVAIIRVSNPDHATWAKPATARRMVEAVGATASANTLGPALRRAQEMLRQSAAANHSLFIITDLQAATWREPLMNAEEFDDTSVFVADVGIKRSGNLAVTQIEMLTPTAIVNRPFRVRGKIEAWAPKSASRYKVVVQLVVEQESVAAAEEEVRPPTPFIPQFSFLPRRVADLPARIALTGGPFGAGIDDQRYFILRTRPVIRVLVCGKPDSGNYVATALDPFGDSNKTGIAPQVIDVAGASSALTDSTFDALILADCPALDASGLEALKTHLGTGGGVLAFLGGDVGIASWQDRLVRELTGDDSFTLGSIETAPEGTAFGLTNIDTTHQPLRMFANPRAGDLSTLRFMKTRRLQTGPDTRVLAAFDNGSPALLEWRVQQGRLVLFNTSANDAWGEHIRCPAYVPLLHRLCEYIARPARSTVDDVLVGERPALRGVHPLPRTISLISPKGERYTLAVEDGLLPEVKVPGVYFVRWGEHEAAFAVNVDPAESDMTRIDGEAVRKALAPMQVKFTDKIIEPRILQENLEARVDLSLPLLFLALMLILVEGVFSIVRRGSEEKIGSAHRSAQ
ncbi:MAG: BatA domain-containing protein [Candidatus Zipacnadales bacterium]